jgi:uncharacterized PurR-regulated membrane protein YhhQ (DUF165 family)
MTLRSTPARLALAAALVGTVVLANVLSARYGLVSAGFGLLVSAGTYAAGLALAIRDALDRAAGLVWVLVTIAVGIVLSYFLSTPALAVASAAAFACSELADLGVFRGLRRRSLVVAIVASNAVGAVVDTLVFLPLAHFPVTPETVGGQILVKAVWMTAAALVVLGLVRALRSRAVHA